MEYEKSFHSIDFFIIFNPLIFFKITFLENYDRYEAETFRVDYLEHELLILVETDSLWLFRRKTASLIFAMVRWSVNIFQRFSPNKIFYSVKFTSVFIWGQSSE